MGRFLLSAFVFAAMVYLAPSPTLATPEYSRRSDKECAYCHPAKGFSLTNAGKYYKEHKTLKGYQPATADGKKSDAGGSKSSH